jgi:hypothetical protein
MRKRPTMFIVHIGGGAAAAGARALRELSREMCGG